MKINKSWTRRLTTVLTLLLLASSVPSYGAAPRFKDVPAKHWAYSYIEDMANLGYLSGYADGNFKPNSNLTFMEAMSTLSRLTNPTTTEKTNASVAYGSLLTELKVEVAWEREALSIALYKDIVTENELRNANTGGLLRKPIHKVTVTAFIARAMGLEEMANSKQVVVLPYKDASTIDTKYVKYIQVLLDSKVLSSEGEGDGKFAPKSNLTRQVIATMLSQSYAYLQKNPTAPSIPEPPKPVETELVKGSIIRTTNDLGRMFLVIDDGFGGEAAYVIVDNTSITIDGRISSSVSLIAGQEVEITFKKGNRDLASIKAISVDEDMDGIIKSVNSTTYKITLEYKEGTKTLTKSYDIDKKSDIYLNDKISDLKDLKEGDTVKIQTKNSIIYDIDARSKVQKIEGIIKEITSIKDSRDTEYYITIVDSKDNSYKFLIDSKTDIYRNNKSAKVGDLKIKDSAYIVSEYDVVKDIEAEVVKKDVKGYVVSITNRVNKNTLVTVKNIETDKDEEYELTRDVYIKIDNKVASSLPNNPGYYVVISLEGDQITEVYADSGSMETSINGKITYIDSKNRIIEVTVDNINFEGDDYARERAIYVSPKAIINFPGSVKQDEFSSLRKGDRIIAVGQYEGSNFVADTILVR